MIISIIVVEFSTIDATDILVSSLSETISKQRDITAMITNRIRNPLNTIVPSPLRASASDFAYLIFIVTIAVQSAVIIATIKGTEISFNVSIDEFLH
jgi:hypothetical protein